MKFFLVMLFFAAASACSVIDQGFELPVEVGVRYEVEPNLFVTISPDGENGWDLKIDGEGNLSKYVSYKDGVCTIFSPYTGTVYEVLIREGEKPRVTVIPPQAVEVIEAK